MGDVTMEKIVMKPRRPWLAALMSLFGSPVGQIYAGRLYRSILLWVVGSLLSIATFAIAPLTFGRWSIFLLLVFGVGFSVCLTLDAYFVAKRNRHTLLVGYQRWWVYLLAYVVFAAANLLVTVTVRSFVAEAFMMNGRSMAPTLFAGERILVDKLWCSPYRLRRNDVVVFESKGPGSALFAMRLVGLPGDKIEIVNEKVFLNGQAWADPHAFFEREVTVDPALANFGLVEVPEDSFFVLGDNRRRANDSRFIGAIPFAGFYGKAIMVYMSREPISPNPTDFSYSEIGSIRWSRIGTRLD